MVDPFCFAFIWFRVQGSGFRALVAASPLFLLGRCPEVAFKSPVTSHSYDTREEIGSHVWCQILRLSPHLFWLGLFTHGSFSSAQDDDTRGRKGSHLGDTLHVLGLAVLYYDTSRLLETEVPQRDFRVWPNPKRRLACPLRRLPVRPNGPRQRRKMDPRGGVKDYVRLPVFHLSSRPKWRDPSCRAVNRERGKGEKGSTKVSFE